MAEEPVKKKKVEDPNSAMYKIKMISNRTYDEAWAAKERGETICWCASNGPVEILETLGITALYPENQAVAIAARGKGEEMCTRSENYGYSNDICAYARISMAYAQTENCDALPMPLPDFLLCSSSICNCMIKWYESIAVELNIPMVMVDIPFISDYEPSEAQIEYFKDQFWDAVHEVEQITGKKWDDEKFRKVMKTCSRTSKAWLKATSYAKYKPSPFNGFDVFNLMAVMLTARCREDAAEAMEQLCEEYEQRVAKNETSFPAEEEFRIMYEGIPCWPWLRSTFRELKNRGINMVTNIYGDSYAFVYDDMDSMARAYCTIQNANGFEYSRNTKIALCKEFEVDGLLGHVNRSCKVWSGTTYELTRQIAEACDLPLGSFDGDQADPRNFSEAQYRTRVQALTEIMDANKS